MAYRQLAVEETQAVVPLNRRDFLKMRVSEGRRVLELSCERLFMRYTDACSGAGRRQVSNHDELTSLGRPSAGFETPTPEALFDELERQLAQADELRVLEPDWLNGGEFAREVGARVDAFEQRGGEVRFGSFSASPTPKFGAPES